MLIKGETYNQRKRQILETIKVSRKMIKTVNKLQRSDLAYKVIQEEQKLIKQAMQELVELKRWQDKRVYEAKQMANR